MPKKMVLKSSVAAAVAVAICWPLRCMKGDLSIPSQGKGCLIKGWLCE